MRLPRLVRVMSALLAPSLLLAGCGQKQNVVTTGALTHIKVGIIPAIDIAPLYIGLKRGYFKAEGLDVELAPEPAGPAAITAIINGQIDFSFADYVMFFGTVSHGAKAHVIADTYQIGNQTQPILAMPNSSIRTPRDLAGKKIGVLAPNNIQVLLINEQLKAYGVDPKTVHYVPMGFPDEPGALKKGEVDAISTVEPFSTIAESKFGAVVVADMDAGATTNAPISGFVSSEAWAVAHPAAKQAFRRAMQRAAVDAAQRSVVQDVLVNDIKLDPQTAAIVHVGVYPTSLSPNRLERIVDLMGEANMLAKPIDVKALAS